MLPALVLTLVAAAAAEATVAVSGELKQWHKVTLTLDGPFARERDAAPNPFLDYRLAVTFTHESGRPAYAVPGYFAADGNAGETSAQGRLQYVGGHYLRFAGSGEYFLKAGPDSPETLLAYADFDGTVATKPKVPLKTWAPHARDWRPGDPTWKGGKGKGLVGALNYLAGRGVNAFSFLTYTPLLPRAGRALRLPARPHVEPGRGEYPDPRRAARDGGGASGARPLRPQPGDPHAPPGPGPRLHAYMPLLGPASHLTGASLQNRWDRAHQRTLRWRRASARAGRPWVVANDEQGDASLGVPADPGYEGFRGPAKEKGREYDLHDARRHTLWGTLLAGGAGVEYYFGYSLPQNDLLCEDWRSRERSWHFARVALDFFRDERVPFQEMEPADALVANPAEDNSRYGFARRGEIYLVYLPEGGPADLDLAGAAGRFTVGWLDPRAGGPLRAGPVREVEGGAKVSLGAPPADLGDDWLAVVRRRK